MNNQIDDFSAFYVDQAPQPQASPMVQVNGSSNTLSAFEYLRITDKTDIPTPEPVLKIAGEIIAVAEDIFTISGASKSGKTALECILIGASISDTGQVADGIDGVEVQPNTNRKAVIHLDTEQARHKHQWNVKTILKRADFATCPDHYLSYNIRQLDIDKYADITSGICQAASDKCGGIHSIWIDGGADYIADVNDPERSNAAVKYFEELAIKYHTAVFIIVHTNPGSDKERGHFGSQCQRKSGGIIMVKSNNDISFIEPKMLRYAGKADIPQLTFKFDKEKGYHVGFGRIESEETDPEKIKEAKVAAQRASAWKLCENIFSGQKSFSREKTLKQIMARSGCAERKASGIFSTMNANDMILKGVDDNYRINTQYINELQ